MIEGQLVVLRPIETADLPFLQDLTNHAEVAGRVVGWDFPVSLHGQTAWLAASAGNHSTHRFLIADRVSGVPLGLTGLWDIDWHNRTALTAVKLHPSVTLKGLGRDSIMTIQAWAFYAAGLRRLYGSILDFNGPSMGAYVGKSGWMIEGCARQAIFRRGEWVDSYHVAVLKSDFDGLPDAPIYIDLVCPVAIDDKVDLSRFDRPAAKQTADGQPLV